MLSHCQCERKSERDSMHFLWLQSARWLGFPGGTDNYNFDIPCGSGGRLKCLSQGASDVVTPLNNRAFDRRCVCVWNVSIANKGVLVYSPGRALYAYDLTSTRTFRVADASNPVYVLDVDSLNAHAYWIDGQRMRRARMNGDEAVVAPPQDLCRVNNASGIAYDWITRSLTLGLKNCCFRKHGQIIGSVYRSDFFSV